MRGVFGGLRMDGGRKDGCGGDILNRMFEEYLF